MRDTFTQNRGACGIYLLGRRVLRVTSAFFCMGLVAWPSVMNAQTSTSDRPLSAIDWLSDSITLPPASSHKAILPPLLSEPETSTNASVGEVTVSTLQAPILDGIGLFSATTTGLPQTLWGKSRPDDLAARIKAIDTEIYPALQRLLMRLLVAEVDPPKGQGANSDRLFLARIDRLLSIGSLEYAQAMLERASTNTPSVFSRSFDTALLLGNEDKQCKVLRRYPDLSPNFTARVFCLARSGDWDAAVLTLEIGRALGFISDEDDALLVRFLDPDLFETEPDLARPKSPSALVFRLYEAIGQHLDTSALPLAFAQSDLRSNIGWKARAQAGERLARVGSVTDNQILGLYFERRPSASGGIWDRMRAVSELENALKTKDIPRISLAVTELWPFLEESGLEVAFSQFFGPRLASLKLEKQAKSIAFHMGLLSDDFEEIAQNATFEASESEAKIMQSIALGNFDDSDDVPLAVDAKTRAVLEGLAAPALPTRLRSLVDQNRLGEAILRAIDLFEQGSHGDLDEVSDALAFFRHIGLEQVARQAALEFLILERRG